MAVQSVVGQSHAARLPAAFLGQASGVRSAGAGDMFRPGLVQNARPLLYGVMPSTLSPYGVPSWSRTLRSAGDIRPAGQYTDPNVNSYDINGNLISSGTSTTGTSTQTGVFTLAGQGLGIAGTAIAAAINSGNQQALADINARNQQFIATLQAQQATATSAAQQQALQTQLNAQLQLRSLLAQTETTNMPFYIAMVGIGAVGLGIIAWVVTQNKSGGSRRNPVIRRGGHRHFVSAAHLRKMRSR